jgi:ribokinase
MKKILVIGSVNIDITATVNHFPSIGETILGNNLRYAYGGKGANQAMACGKLGGDVIFLACVGEDDNGHKIVDHLSENNIDTSHVKFSKDKPTGTALINIDEKGDNEIIVIQGANLDCDKEYIENEEKLFKEVDYVLLQLEIPLESVEKAIELAAKYNKQVILNPAPADSNLNSRLYQYITYMTPNENESSVMAKDNNSNVVDNARILRKLGVKNVIVTLGSKGSILYKDDDNIINVMANKVKAIDTVAAGDCYNGAFVTALAKGMKEVEAMKYASLASAIAVTKKGAQESIPCEEEMNTFWQAKF